MLPPKHVLFLIHRLGDCQSLKLYFFRILFELVPNYSKVILSEAVLHRVLTGLGSGAIFATDFVLGLATRLQATHCKRRSGSSGARRRTVGLRGISRNPMPPKFVHLCPRHTRAF